jgi:deazaflavin-dependent oxidoreductase (nitroreductase family)
MYACFNPRMARQYRLGPLRKAINVLTTRMARRGRGPKFLYLLTVRGRSTGEPRSTPVDVMEVDGRRYLVAPYGPVGWVKNARAAGEVELTRGSSERCRVREVGPQEAVPVLRQYLRLIKVVRPYFDVKPDASDEEFARIAPHKPVFELVPAG